MIALPALLRRRLFVNRLKDYAANGVTPAMVSNFEDGLYLGTVHKYGDWTHTGSLVAGGASVDPGSGEVLSLPGAKFPEYDTADGFSMAIHGAITYADNNAAPEARIAQYKLNLQNAIYWDLGTASAQTGRIRIQQVTASTYDVSDSAIDALSPGADVPFSIAVRHGASYVRGAVHGTLSTENNAPTALFDGDGVALGIGVSGSASMTISKVIVWIGDIGDDGIQEASTAGFFT